MTNEPTAPGPSSDDAVPSTEGEAEELVSDIVGEVAERKARVEATEGQSVGSPLAARLLPPLVVLLVAVWGWALYSLTREPEPLAPAVQEVELTAQLAVLVDEIESYRDGEGRYPTDLAELELSPDGTSYRLLENGFELSLTEGATTVRYRLGDPVDPLQAAVTPRARGF